MSAYGRHKCAYCLPLRHAKANQPPPPGPSGLLRLLAWMRGTHAAEMEMREPMTDLTAHLEVLMRRYAAACVSLAPSAALDRVAEEFRAEIDLLAAKYGQKAVDKAMNAMPLWPSVSLH